MFLTLGNPAEVANRAVLCARVDECSFSRVCVRETLGEVSLLGMGIWDP